MPRKDEMPERGKSQEAHAAHQTTVWTLANDAGDTMQVDDWNERQHDYMAGGWRVQSEPETVEESEAGEGE